MSVNPKRLDKVVQELKKGTLLPDDFPPIRIFKKDGKIWVKAIKRVAKILSKRRYIGS